MISEMQCNISFSFLCAKAMDKLSNDGDYVLIPGKAFGIDNVEDATRIQLRISHEDLLQLLVRNVDEAAFPSTRCWIHHHENSV